MSIETLLPKLIRASLDNDYRTLRTVCTKIIRKLKDTNPEIAEEIATALSYHGIGANTLRAVGIEDAPLNNESRKSLAKVEEPVEIIKPILSNEVESIINEFILERESAIKLIAAGLNPSSSILLYGPPGVGKTHLANYLSGVFGLKFVTLDLATSISSYLGKTGENIKSVFDYARQEPSLLFLDEFDAIAKKRDDVSDLGELKRIVNVLLKELEDWPTNSILIAATNHPELLDLAIWRRFDRAIELKLPEEIERKKIITLQLSNEKDNRLKDLLPVIANLTEGLSYADICKLVERSKRKSIIFNESISKTLIQELISFSDKREITSYKKLSKIAKDELKMSIREIADWIGKSPSAVQYYLKQEKESKK
ncbi:AAA family ATPase [Bacillus infantis]|uniref:ATP-binding protein n=1 Tax=Bacillus infantis TaxID=324767 RepID=A0A5D4RJX2_9BACI|nr:ATP-binding protein [Bacillus infantis]TYS51099.1 ATP-binding protein [Bacillus infantis]